ncbi:sugar ABC transporter ATP-binding protein [soil metagenome]
MASPFLALTDISKAYPGVVALKGVDMTVGRGEVIGLVGENGAGKSTLMRILGGVVTPDRGVIAIDGVEHASLTIASAGQAGIAFVHQELNLFDNLDVAANVFIGREPLRGGPLKLVDTPEMRRRAEPILRKLGADFTPATPVSQLSLAQRQLVEIAKALSIDARLVIMDEPTSSLTVTETAKLLKIVADLKADGVSVIYISHRLHEVERCADRVVVLRDGAKVGELTGAKIQHEAMIHLMIGRDLKSLYIQPASAPGSDALTLTDLRTTTFPDREVTLSLRHGEILGLAGLVGSGRTEVARAVFGIDRRAGGEIRLKNTPIQVDSPRHAIEQGIFLVPEDRKQSGILLDISISQNISLPDLGHYSKAWLVQPSDEDENAERQKTSLNIRTPSVTVLAKALSGGNQQKVVLAKWLSMKPTVIIFDEPTRGVDVGAKQEIYALMRVLSDTGVAILMISSDMEEVIGVSDRMAVMHEGRISGFLERSQFSEDNVLRLAVGKALN